MPDPQIPLWRVFMGRCRAGHVRPLPGGFPASFPCRKPPREGFTPLLRTFQKHTCLFYSIPANSARISALISSTERMDFAPFASAVVHSMRCQPSVRAQYSAAARLRARYSVSYSWISFLLSSPWYRSVMRRWDTSGSTAK